MILIIIKTIKFIIQIIIFLILAILKIIQIIIFLILIILIIIKIIIFVIQIIIFLILIIIKLKIFIIQIIILLILIITINLLKFKWSGCNTRLESFEPLLNNESKSLGSGCILNSLELGEDARSKSIGS